MSELGVEAIRSYLVGETEGVSLSKTVGSSSTETVSYTAKSDGKIEGIQIRIYAGAENDLHLTLEILNSSGEVRKNLVSPQGKNYIDGDDDFYEWSALTGDIEKGEKIRVTAKNTNASNPYDFRVNFSINYEGMLG